MIRGAVLGSPINHSLSPILHQGAFNTLGIDGRYEAIDVPSGKLLDFFTKYSDDFDYFSLTMPLKEEAFGLSVELDELSQRIGSVNTLWKKDEKWRGTSTDGSGFLSAIKTLGFSHFKNAMILGAGGTARAIAGALDGHAETISVLGRTSTRRQALSACITKSDFTYISWDNAIDLSPFDLVVNTTPAGAADLLAQNLPTQITSLLFDVLYKPWPTVLALRWEDRGGQVINGKELLLWQGLDQLDLVVGKNADRQQLALHLRPLLAQS
ncbi:MAG: shikimate dehydrogenase family protein [Candidatus Planktophila sp.]